MNTDIDALLDPMVEAMDETQQEFGEETTWHDLARAALGAVHQEIPVALHMARHREQAFLIAAGLTADDLRAQFGDLIASRVEESFRAHFVKADERGRRQIADPCEHDWEFDGFFWHRCKKCGAIS